LHWNICFSAMALQTTCFNTQAFLPAVAPQRSGA